MKLNQFFIIIFIGIFIQKFGCKQESIIRMKNFKKFELKRPVESLGICHKAKYDGKQLTNLESYYLEYVPFLTKIIHNKNYFKFYKNSLRVRACTCFSKEEWWNSEECNIFFEELRWAYYLKSTKDTEQEKEYREKFIVSLLRTSIKRKLLLREYDIEDLSYLNSDEIWFDKLFYLVDRSFYIDACKKGNLLYCKRIILAYLNSRFVEQIRQKMTGVLSKIELKNILKLMIKKYEKRKSYVKNAISPFLADFIIGFRKLGILKKNEYEDELQKFMYLAARNKNNEWVNKMYYKMKKNKNVPFDEFAEIAFLHLFAGSMDGGSIYKFKERVRRIFLYPGYNKQNKYVKLFDKYSFRAMEKIKGDLDQKQLNKLSDPGLLSCSLVKTWDEFYNLLETCMIKNRVLKN